MTRDIAIIILNFRRSEMTINCVKKIKNSQECSYSVVIVDNNSKDGSFEYLTQYFEEDKHVIVLQSGKNLGYAFGNNVGISYAIRKGFEWICLINNDVLVQPDTMKKLMNSYPKNQLAIIGPVILESDQKSSTIQSIGATNNLWKGQSSLNFKGYTMNSDVCENLPEKYSVDYISGACMFFNADVFSLCGPLPEDYFLYYEENEWCVKAQKKGVGVYCITNCYVSHHRSSTVSSISGLADYYLTRNLFMFERRVTKPHQYIFFVFYFFLHHIVHLKKIYLIPVIDGLVGKVGKTYRKDL